MASAPPASIPARAMKTASPSMPLPLEGRHRGPHPTGQPRFSGWTQLRPADGVLRGSWSRRCFARPSPLRSKVRKWCTIRVAGHSRSLPPHRQGLYADWVEDYQGHLVERMERVRGEGDVLVNYRHVIGSLVRKPRSLCPYLRCRADLRRVASMRLHLAATTMGRQRALEAVESFDYAEVRDLAESRCPKLRAGLVWEDDRLSAWSRHDGHQRGRNASASCAANLRPTMGAQSVAHRRWTRRYGNFPGGTGTGS